MERSLPRNDACLVALAHDTIPAESRHEGSRIRVKRFQVLDRIEHVGAAVIGRRELRTTFGKGVNLGEAHRTVILKSVRAISSPSGCHKQNHNTGAKAQSLSYHCISPDSTVFW